MKYKILTFLGFCFFYCNTYAQIGAVWNTATSGTLNGVPFTITGFDNPELANFDVSGSNYSAAPLGNNQQVVGYENKSDWTVTFDSPIKNLRLYIVFWRNGFGVNSSGTFSVNGTKLSGNNFTVTGTELDMDSGIGLGIVEFTGNITSLSYTPDGEGTLQIALTFGVANPSVPTLSEWGLLNLVLLLMICGTLVLIGGKQPKKTKRPKFNKFLSLWIILFSSIIFTACPTIIEDTTPTAANAKDGNIEADEYVDSSIGINNGFGGVIGNLSDIYWDSDKTGNLAIALESFPPGGRLDSVAVIYIDAATGGFNSTSSLSDVGDRYRAAISGNGTTSGTADLTFASIFEADYAIAFDHESAGLWELNSGGSHTFLKDLGITPANNPTAIEWEMDGFDLTDLGLSVGDSLLYVATYIDPVIANRSDEFHGVFQNIRDFDDSAVPPGNIGANPITLNEGDYNVFKSFLPLPTIPTLSEWGLLILALLLMICGTLYLLQPNLRRI